MSSIIHTHQNMVLSNEVVKELYGIYAKKLFAYTRKNYTINEDDIWTLIYKTLYKIADVNDNYHFESEQKRSSFLFKTHINYIRNYFRDTKTFEAKNTEIDLTENHISSQQDNEVKQNLHLSVLQEQLDRLEEWERILLLMRGQDIPYNKIAEFVNKPEKHLKVYYSRLKNQLLISINKELQQLNNLKNGK